MPDLDAGRLLYEPEGPSGVFRRTEPAEVLVLPGPANDLWLKTEETVRAELQRAGEHRLGGGTLLAARWKHRLSLDLDLTIEPRGHTPNGSTGW